MIRTPKTCAVLRENSQFALANASLWAGVAAFATLIWPVAASSFDQTQHAWFLLVAVLLADAAAEKRSSWLGLLTGFVLSLVLHYQPAYAILFVPIAVAVVPWHGEDTIRGKLRLPVLIGIGALPGLLALIYFNYYRSAGSYALVSLNSGDQGLWGNPVIGALVLLVSPGKGILLFTPIMLVAALGVREMWGKNRRLTSLIGGVTITHFALVSSLAFPGGDWCWGPRYLAVTLPLVCLMLPYGARRLAPVLVVSLVIVSLAVQILGLTRDHQRFYLDHNVKPYFWTEDTTFHLRTSQLSYRISELLDPNSPGRFETFSSAPYPLLTYAPFGPPAALVPRSKEWARQFAVFYWPRPWPLWMIRLPEPLRFLNVQAIVTVFVVMLVTGLVLIVIGLQLNKAARSLPGHDPQASG